MKSRNAFTLIEMLVVLIIVVLLAALTLVMVSAYDVSDTTATSANSIVAACGHAQAQASTFQQPRGLRLVLAKPGDRYVTSVRIIGGPDKFEQSKQPTQFEDPPGTFTPNLDAVPIRTITTPGNKYTTLANLPPVWAKMEAAGALDPAGAELTINGQFYRISKVGADWRTTRPVYAPFDNHSKVSYTLGGLRPTVVTDGRVTELPKGTVIDLDASLIPEDWKLTSGDYSPYMDVMFAPDGRFVSGIIKDSTTMMLVIGSAEDLGKAAGDPNKKRSERVVAVFRSGLVTASSIDTTDANNNGVADDPFNFAHRGSETK